MAHERVLVFARSPEPGRVKTRLIPRLGAERAARLHLAALTDLIERLKRGGGHDVVVYHDGASAHAALAALEVPLRAQRGDDLGERLAAAFADESRTGAARLVALGADSPDLPLERVAQAFAALERVALVLAPAYDGGYVLLGARGAPAVLFSGISWGSERVLEQTLGAAHRAGVSFELLEPWYDLDRPEDLRHLERTLTLRHRYLGEDPCPRTRRLLAERA